MPTYFLTCTTHGTWLHGDERGSYNKFGEFIPPDELLQQSMKDKLNAPPFYLSDSMREIVRAAFVEVAENKSWTIHRMAVQHNHFHIAISADTDDPRKVFNALKSKATMRLRKAKEITADFSPWTTKGNCQTITTNVQLTKVCHYIENHNVPATDEISP